MAQVTSGRVTSNKMWYSTFYVDWERTSYSVADNSSTIKWKAGLIITNNAEWHSNAVKINSIYINGEKVLSDKTYSNIKYTGTHELATDSLTIKHNTDGTKAFDISISGWLYNTGSPSGSGSFELVAIPRQATITNAPHFTDEDNPTITYNNAAGNAVTSLKACIADANGQNLFAEYRDIPKTGTSYTFNLTDAERNALRWATINSPNLTVKFYVTTVIAGITYYSTMNKIMTITNASPTIAPVIEDVGASSTVLTGDKNKIIKGFNYIKASVNATAKKNASIKTQTISCGGETISGANANFNSVESATFVVTATDSRGYTTTQTIKKTLIDYIKLTCNLVTNNPTPAGAMAFKISGNYFNGSFGATANTLTLQYRYKENNGAYSAWINASPAPSISGNTYEATVNITGLDYRNAYTFQARAIDKVNTAGINSAEKKVKTTPVYDWGENDFQFNVEVYDKDGRKLGTEITANDYDAASLSGKSLLESGWVTITPTANTPTEAFVTFKKSYAKKPVVLVTASTGVIGTQVAGASINGITNDGVNIVTHRTNSTPTTIYYYVFGEVE